MPELVHRDLHQINLSITPKNQWTPGESALFEYSLPFDPQSDICAALHHRTGQTVTVLAEIDPDNNRAEFSTMAERGEAGALVCYKVRFPDGFEYDVFEDELGTVESAVA